MLLYWVKGNFMGTGNLTIENVQDRIILLLFLMKIKSSIKKCKAVRTVLKMIISGMDTSWKLYDLSHSVLNVMC